MGSEIREGMTVYAADGEKLGKILQCDPDAFIIEKGFFFPKDYIARYEDVADATGDEVRLLRGRASLESGEASVPHDRAGHELGYGAAGAAPAAVEGSLGMNASGAGLGATRADLPDIAAGTDARREIPGEQTARSADEARMTRAEEELDVVKREREAGEVRLRKDVVTETKHVEVPVTREEVRVERVPASDRAAASGEATFDEESVSVPLREEEVEIRKRPVVKEEVRVRKDRVVEQRAAEADVRKERVEIEGEGKPKRDPDFP